MSLLPPSAYSSAGFYVTCSVQRHYGRAEGLLMGNRPDQTTYAAAGVNLKLGDIASPILYTAARRTWEQRQDRLGEVIIPHDDVSGVRYVAVGALPADVVMGIGFDGIGTKIEIAERM